MLSLVHQTQQSQAHNPSPWLSSHAAVGRPILDEGIVHQLIQGLEDPVADTDYAPSMRPPFDSSCHVVQEIRRTALAGDVLG